MQILTFKYADKILQLSIQMKVIEESFLVMLFSMPYKIVMAFLSLWMSPNAYFKIILMKAATEWKIPCGKQTFIFFPVWN